jgi:hypothetical protein
MKDEYWRGVLWIIRERAGSNGGWPPREISKVSGWAVVRMLAHIANKSPREVAHEIIDTSMRLERMDEEGDKIQ